jgi:hypothetical protein
MSLIVKRITELQAVRAGRIAVEPLDNERPQVLLPGDGRPISEFAEELGSIIAKDRIWFVKSDEVVQIKESEISKNVKSMVFHQLTPVEMRTAIEQHVKICVERKQQNTTELRSSTMSRECSSALLASPQFKKALPRIDRIVDVPIPLLVDKKLVWLEPGYNAQFNTYCPLTAPRNCPLSLAEAKGLLKELLGDFPFADDLSLTVAIARLITPMCRGLMGFSERPPVFLFEGNRPRASKDYLAGCTTLLYEGRVNEDAPLDDNPEETGKRITAALLSGRRIMHFANCRGHINNSAIEHAATAKIISARRLGSNDGSSDLTLPNEIEFSLSANTGFSFTEDFNLRCRKITLHFGEEDANGRTFKYPDLHGWILQHRAELLNALGGLIQHWYVSGMPKGPTPFASFPTWAQFVGGILTACGLSDPCVAQVDGTLTGDTDTEDMKRLFKFLAERHGESWLSAADIRADMSTSDLNLFGYLDLNERSGQTSFGKKLTQFIGRTLGGIQMRVNKTDEKRPKFQFTARIEPVDKTRVNKLLGDEQKSAISLATTATTRTTTAPPRKKVPKRPSKLEPLNDLQRFKPPITSKPQPLPDSPGFLRST